MFVRVKGKGKYRYLQLVENHREGHRTVQRVLCTLGREEETKASGSIDALIRSLARFSQQAGLDEMNRASLAKSIGTNTLSPDAMPSSDRATIQTRTSAAPPRRFPPKSVPKYLRASSLSGGASTPNILRKSPLFSDLAEEQLVELSQVALERRLKGGQFLYFQNDPVESWYVVTSGMVKAVRHSPSGKDIIRAIYGPGETIANIVLFVGEPHTCSCQAITDTTALEIKRDELVSFLHRYPESGFKILVRMISIGGKRFQDSLVSLTELAMERTDNRLARTLVALSAEFGPIIPLTHREIAEMAGTAAETATRFLSRLRKTGVVQSYRRKVAILRQDKLRLLAQVPLPE